MQHKRDEDSRAESKPPAKRVGDWSPNPLPDEDISTPQPKGDDNEANPQP